MDDFFIDSDGVRLAARDYGGTGRPVILVHGGPGPTLTSWDGFAPRLVDRFRPIAFDQRGHGQSADAPDYSYAALSGDIHGVIDTLGLAGPIVVGHSWGGWISLNYAAHYPECAGVVAVDGPITGNHRRQTEDDWARMEQELRTSIFSRLFEFVGTSAELDELHDWLLATSSEYDPGISDIRRNFVKGPDGILRSRHTAASFMALNRAVDAQEPPSTDVYGKIGCPIMLVMATEGGVFSREAVERVLEQRPEVGVAWLDGGHAVQRDRPDELAALITEFADSLDS